MKLNFEDLQYQQDAVDAVVQIFDGAEEKESLFTIGKNRPIENHQKSLDLEGEGISYDLGHGNRLSLSDVEILENTRKVQEQNGIEMTNDLHNRNFTVEMETGTGKTYVYIKSILKLNKKYGFTKFIIVVPSVAIREGVYKSLQITEEHFKLRYDNVNYDYFIYDSGQLGDIHNFSTSTDIQIMIINIDAFRKTFNKGDKGNIIHRPSEYLSGNRPIDMIASTNPIVIIDEPQSVDNTKKSKDAIRTLNPLVTLRYSATHKQVYNLVYRLTPVDAYQKDLVKKIEVSSVLTDQASAKPYVKLLSTNKRKNQFSARVELNYKHKDGSIRVKEMTLYPGDDLWEISNGVDYYQDRNYLLDTISVEKNLEYIEFANGEKIEKGQTHGSVSDEAIKRAQIRETIDLHLEKELSYLDKGIKVLSLFFIDKVDNYRMYDDEGNQLKGIYAQWFEEEFNYLMRSKKYNKLKEKYGDYISYDAEKVHDGYFSVDNKGRVKNTRGHSQDDSDTYELIMKDKEKLLSFSEPLRFIFSHSALKEGWDNPNVFQVCTLVETKDDLTKRQKIGRGLRLAVDQTGQRVYDGRYNILSIVANESYREFATGLQREFESDGGYNFNVVEKVSFSGQKYINKDGEEDYIRQAESIEIHDSLVNAGYLNKKGKIQKKFYDDILSGSFKVEERFSIYKKQIKEVLNSKSEEVEIMDAHQNITIRRNKEVYLSEEFKALWDKIKQKTVYSIEMDIDNFVNEAIQSIKKMPPLQEEVIRSERGRLSMDDSGIPKNTTLQTRKLGNVYDFDDVVYPDFVRRLQEATGLLRKTLIRIIRESNRFSDFSKNPELWIKEVSRRINLEKRRAIASGIKYYPKDNDYYVAEEIFDDSNLRGSLGKNAVHTPSKHIFDHAIYDSKIEAAFAIEAEQDPDVKIFAKLPSKFVIDTPYGNYNPDWVLVIDNGSGEEVYFVAETKGAEIGENRPSEDGKILCGREHFRVIDSEIQYEVIKQLNDLKTKV